MTQIVHDIIIRAKTEGVAQAASSINLVAAAQKRLEERSAGQTWADRAAKDYERLQRQIDPLANSVAKFERAQRVADAALIRGRISAEEYGDTLEKAAGRYGILQRANDNTTKSMGLARHEMINLGRQMADVGTMAAMGASGMQILASQGAQVVDVFASSERGLSGWARSVGPTAAGVAAVAAALGAGVKAAWDFSAGQDAVAKSLSGVGRLSGATVDGINRAAEASAGAARISVASAREIGSTFAATGKIGQDLYGDLTVTAARYAKTTGTDVTEATGKLAQAFADPVKGAAELNKTLGFLSGRTLELMERQSAAGDRLGAQKTLQDALKTSLVGVTEGTNAWATAWEKVANAAKNAYDATGKALQRRFDPTLAEQIEDQRTRMDTPARRGLNPWQRAGRDARAGAEQDALAELLERQMWADINKTLSQRDADTAEKTLKAKGIVAQLTPTNADILQLQTWRRELDDALKTGQAQSGTAEALARVNKLLSDGGTEASRLRDAARDAFNISGLRPYERGLAEIENRYRALIEAANGNKEVIAGLNAARADDRRAYNVQNTDIPRREYRDRLDEMGRSLAFQRDSFGQTPEVVETLRARMELLNDAARTGQDVAARYGAGWEALAGQMGRAKAATDELQRSQQNLIAGFDEIRSGSRGLFTGIFSDVRQGKSPLDGIVSSLGRMQDQMFDRMISKPLIEGLMGRDGTGQGGWLAGLFGQGGMPALMGANGQSGSGNIGDVLSLDFGNDNAEPAEIAA